MSRNRWMIMSVLLALGGCGDGTSDDAGLDATGARDDTGSVYDTGVPLDAHLAPDAAVVAESCTTVGETRVGPCGRMCGQASQRCSEALVWENTSACLMEGECPRGTSEMRPMGMCGEETRLCQNDCTWTGWETSRPEGGECRPGELRFTRDEARCGAARGTYEVCGASCTFGPGSGTCTDGCGDTARTTPEWAREVCVPAGTFIRGYDDPDYGFTNVLPELPVYLSPYYIDVYPVTVGRFRACNADGVCPRSEALEDLGREEYPHPYVGDFNATQFCEWDAGRRMPTEAEWEKAFRGPAPRRDTTPFGFASRCDEFFSVDCGYRDTDPRHLHDDPYDGLPGTRGYYGTFFQYGGGYEWVSGEYREDYYSDPTSLWDPLGPAPGAQIRGFPPRTEGYIVSRGVLAFDGAGIRCGRSVEVRP